jgi:rod shape-determining protein MreD
VNSLQNASLKLSVMRRVIFYGVLFFILCVAQSSFFARLSFLSVVPSLALGGVAAVALLDEEKYAIVCGIAAGFLADAIGGSGISLSPLIFMISAIVCAQISRKMLPHFLSWLIVMLVAAVLGALGTALNILVNTSGVEIAALVRSLLLPELVATYFISLPIFFLVKLCVRLSDAKTKFKI